MTLHDTEAALGSPRSVSSEITQVLRPSSSSSTDTVTITSKDVDVEYADKEEWIDMSSGIVVSVIGWSIWLLVLVANGYVLVVLMMGQGS